MSLEQIRGLLWGAEPQCENRPPFNGWCDGKRVVEGKDEITFKFVVLPMNSNLGLALKRAKEIQAMAKVSDQQRKWMKNKEYRKAPRRACF